MTGPSPHTGNVTQDTNPSRLRDCDLVMKGGITSGVLYPPVIQQIISDYRFRGIGGTSVGAMAAVVIAAAEFYRQQPQHQGSIASFNCLNKDVREWLVAPGNILRLFQPSRQTRPLLSFALALQSTPKDTSKQSLNTQSSTPSASQSAPATAPSSLALTARFLRAWLFHYPFAFSGSALFGTIIGFILSAILILAFFALFSLFTNTSVALNPWAYLTLLGALLGWQTGNIIGAIFSLPKNFYGLCTGYTPTAQERSQAASIAKKNDPATSQTSANRPAPTKLTTSNQDVVTFQPGTQYTNLTAWLDHLITCLAGKPTDTVLTMKDLAEQNITLKMVTTNLSLTLPYVMPEDLRNFIFNAEEMIEFLPLHIIQHMVNNQPDITNPDLSKRPLIAPQHLPDHYFFLPDPDDLPVALCARMSMSFPVLLSTVKLYAIDREAYDRYKAQPGKLAPDDLNANWFSDGGICSNFPIHFFDAWLPSYPTFGINLLSKERIATCVTMDDQEETVKPDEQGIRLKKVLKEPDTDGDVFIRRADDRPDPEWHKIESLSGFGSAIFGAAQNYHDMLQTNLPSYRERIAQIRLSDNEGGLNLKMSGATIEAIISKGEKAGNLLEEFNFDQHVWVRFLLLMALLEKHISEIEADDLALIAKILKEGTVPDGYPFSKDSQWLEKAKPRFIALLTLVQSWNNQFKDIVQNEPGQYQAKPSTFFQRSIPLAGSGLHVRPKV